MTLNNIFFTLFCTMNIQVVAQPIQLVRNIHPSEDADIYGAFEFDGKLVFGANDGEHGIEYWITDGTASGTQLLKDINPEGSALPLFMEIHNGLLVFRADDGSNGVEPWISDGTGEGTQLLSDCNDKGDGLLPFFQPGIFFQNDLYFVAVKDAGYFNAQLWKKDVTNGETLVVSDQESGTCLSIPSPQLLGDQLYFFYFSLEGKLQMWSTDGTATSLVYDWGILSDINVQFQSDPEGLLFLLLDDGVHGREPWISDGTPSGTKLLKDIHPDGDGVVLGKSMPFLLNDQWVFLADDGVHGLELWVTDGTENGTQFLKDIVPGEDLNLKDMWERNGSLYFPADDGIHGKEWWMTDGTESGTQLMLDLHPAGDGIGEYVSVLDRDSFFYFAGSDGLTGLELWKSDGTAFGTQLVKDIWPGPESSAPVVHLSDFPALNEIHFVADDGVHGREVWLTDGTESGTQLLYDLHPAGSSDPVFLARVNSSLYLEADDGIFSRELYKIEVEPVDPALVVRQIVFPNPSHGETWMDFPEALSIQLIDDKYQYDFLYQSGLASDVYWLSLGWYGWGQADDFLFGWIVKY